MCTPPPRIIVAIVKSIAHKAGGKDASLEHLCALDKTFGDGVADHQILDLLSCSDEVEHRHALRQRNQKGRKQTKEDMLLQICAAPSIVNPR